MDEIMYQYHMGFISYMEFVNKVIDLWTNKHGGEMTAEEIKNEINCLRALANEIEFEIFGTIK